VNKLQKHHSTLPVAFPIELWHSLVSNKLHETEKDVQQGTLALMLLKTLDALGPLHGYGIARRIEQISGWEQTAAIIARFFEVIAQDVS